MVKGIKPAPCLTCSWSRLPHLVPQVALGESGCTKRHRNLGRPPWHLHADFVLHLVHKSGTESLEWLSSRETFGLGYSLITSLLQSWATNFNTNPQSLFPGLLRKQGRKIVLGGFQSEMQRAGWRASFKGPVWAGLYVMSVWWTAACKLCTQGAESGGSGVQNQSGLPMHLSLNK